MTDSQESEETSSCDMDVEPQEKFWVLSKLPFDVSDQMDQMLSVIKRLLASSAQRFSFGFEFKAATEKLYSYLQLFGCHFSKEDHINFLKLYFHLFLDLDAGGSMTSNDYDLIYHVWKKLTKKLRLIEPGELVLDWRPVFDRWVQIRTELWSRTTIGNFDHEFGVRFLILARQWRTFFDEKATPEILKAVRALRYPDYDAVSNHYRVLYADALCLLPCLVREGTFSQTVGLWVEDAIDEFLTSDDDVPVSQVITALGTVASSNCGLVDFDRCLPKLMSLLLASWKVPLTMFECDRTFPVPQEFSPTPHVFADLVPIVVHSITPTSKTLDYLEKIIPALAFISDPSVLKGSDRAVKDFFKSFLQCLKNRLRRERFRGARYAVWSEPTPESARLTDALLDRILLLLAPLLETMLFGKFFVPLVADFLGQMALIRPGLMLPRLQQQLDGEFERMCEAHRILCSLRLANHMLPASLGLGLANEADKRAFRPWAIEMLPSMLKFISINNDSTTEQAVRFISNFAKCVPMRACRHALADGDALCRRTPELEEFVFTFANTTLDYYSESANSEAGGKPTYSWKLLLQFFNALKEQLNHTSPHMRQKVGDLLVQRLTRGQFHWWSPDHWEVLTLMKHVVSPYGARWLPQLLKYAAKLLREMEEDYDCVDAETYPKDIPKDVYMEIFTVITLVIYITPVERREHNEAIRRILRRCLKFRSPGVTKTLPWVISLFALSYGRYYMLLCDSEERAEDECQLKRWGMTVLTSSWQPTFQASPEPEDLAFRDSMLAEIVAPACARLRGLTTAKTSQLTADDRLELRIALLLLNSITQGLSTGPFGCCPPSTDMGLHPGVPEEISGERFLLFDSAKPILVEGQSIWELMLTTILHVTEVRIDDVKFMETLCSLCSSLVGGSVSPWTSGNSHDVLSGRHKLWRFYARASGPAAAYLPSGIRFQDNACSVIRNVIQNINSLNFFAASLCPKRWLLLQRLSCLHLPAKDNGLLVSFTFSLLSSLASFPGAAELLVQPVISHLAGLSNEALELHALVPFVRLLSLIPWMERLGTWTQLIGGLVQLLNRLDKVEMSDLEAWQHRFGITYKGMSMNWQGPSPEVVRLCSELSPLAVVEPKVTQAVIDRQKSDVKEWFDLLATFLSLRVKDQLLEKFLDFVLALYGQNTLGHAPMTAGLANELLKLMRDSLNPNVKSLCVRVLEAVDNAENSGLHFARTIQLPPSSLPLLCVPPNGDVPDQLEPPPVRLAASSDLPQTVFVWDAAPKPSEATQAVVRFASPANLLALIESLLQVLRTNGADSNCDLNAAAGAFAVLASFLGPGLLLPALQARLLALAASEVEEELNLTVAFLRGALSGSCRWSSADLPALWPFLLPVLDTLFVSGRASPAKLDFLLHARLDDPRRLAPLFNHLLSRLETAEPDLACPSTELLATLIHHLLKICSGWRVSAVRRRFDDVMQPIVARLPPSPRSSRLVERWLRLSLLEPTEARLLGTNGLDLEQPTRWLRELFARPSAGEGGEGDMPERLRRLYYLCPIDVESMRQPRAFFALLTDNLQEVLLARGQNFTLNDEASNFASQKIAALTIAVLARVGQLDEVEKVFRAVDEVLSSASPPRSLAFALSLQRQLLCRNAAVIPPTMSARALALCCRHLASDQQPVVRAAEQALAELLCRGVLAPQALLAHLAKEAPPAHVAVHALGAILEAFPHCLAPQTAAVVSQLDALLAQDRSQRLFVEKIIRNFLRAHQDAWEEKWKRQLPRGTLDLVLRLSGSGTYFS